MCKGLDEGGKRCASCAPEYRRGKDRASYAAKKLSATQGASIADLKKTELAITGFDPTISVDESLVNSDLLNEIMLVRKALEYLVSWVPSLSKPENIVSLEERVRHIGANIDARARYLSGVTENEFNLAKSLEGAEDLAATRKALTKKVSLLGKQYDKALLKSGRQDDTTNIITMKLDVARKNLREFESGRQDIIDALLSRLSVGYTLALGEVREFGFKSKAGEGKNIADVVASWFPGNIASLMAEKGVFSFYPADWLNQVELVGKPEGLEINFDSTNKSVGALVHGFSYVLEYCLPAISALEDTFVLRRTSSNGARDALLSNGVNLIRQDSFVNSMVGLDLLATLEKNKAMANVDPSSYSLGKRTIGGSVTPVFHECLCIGVTAIFTGFLAGGLVGLGSLASHKDDDMRQFVLGVLATV